MTVKRKEVFFFDGKTAECVLASDYDALRQENERLVAANKARAEYLTTRRAGNDVDSYVNLAEAEIAALRLQLTDALNRQTCEGGQPYICHALATARSRLSDIESQNRVMWDVANDREARLAEAEAERDKILRLWLDDADPAECGYAADSASAVQSERCCLDYPRCDCNSPPEPDNAPTLQPCGHPWKAQHDFKCILCSSPGVTP